MITGPIVLVIHAGGNDLCFTGVPKLISIIKPDTEYFVVFFSDLVIVWSIIVPRVV